MNALNNRLSKLEQRAAENTASIPYGDMLRQKLEVTASRLDWGRINEEWVASESIFTIIAAGLYCPAPMPGALQNRLRRIAGQEDVAGTLAKRILEVSE